MEAGSFSLIPKGDRLMWKTLVYRRTCLWKGHQLGANPPSEYGSPQGNSGGLRKLQFFNTKSNIKEEDNLKKKLNW